MCNVSANEQDYNVHVSFNTTTVEPHLGNKVTSLFRSLFLSLMGDLIGEVRAVTKILLCMVRSLDMDDEIEWNWAALVEVLTFSKARPDIQSWTHFKIAQGVSISCFACHSHHQ